MADQQATVKSVNSQLEALMSGETLLVQAVKTVNPEKVQLEFAEKMANIEDNAGALLGMFNASDERFSSGARRAWLTAQIAEVGAILNINCGDDAAWEIDVERNKEILPIGILNPTAKGMRFRVKVVETTTPTEYQAANAEKAAKRKGAEGEHILHNGEYIFSNTDVVLKEGDVAPEHVFLASDESPVTKTLGIKDEVGM